MELLKRLVVVAFILSASSALSACQTPPGPDIEPAGRTEQPGTGRAVEPGADVPETHTDHRSAPGAAEGGGAGGSK